MQKLRPKLALFGNKGMLGSEFQKSVPGLISCAYDRGNINIFDKESVLKKLETFDIDWIINCAAYTNVERAEKEYSQAYSGNVIIPKILTEVANELGIGICHFSTDYVFDGTFNRPYKETDPENPISAYGKTKLLGEYEIKKANKGLICRISWLYGPYGRCFPMVIMKQILEDKKDAVVVNDQLGAPTYTLDVVSNSLKLMSLGRNGVFHIPNGGQATWYEFAIETAKHFNVEKNIFSITSDKIVTKAKRPMYSIMSTEKFEEETGARPQHWKFALKHFLNRSR